MDHRTLSIRDAASEVKLVILGDPRLLVPLQHCERTIVSMSAVAFFRLSTNLTKIFGELSENVIMLLLFIQL